MGDTGPLTRHSTMCVRDIIRETILGEGSILSLVEIGILRVCAEGTLFHLVTIQALKLCSWGWTV